jgi:crossover junction endodeoxyribonuclease RuvC
MVSFFVFNNMSEIILGIDPGTNILGYGAVMYHGNTFEMIDAGILNWKSSVDPYEKLKVIHESVIKLIQVNRPIALAIEAPFFGKNVQSMLKLGRAQGVAIAAAVQCNLPVFEYAPKKIKQSITGNGNASKQQVSAMVCRMLQLNEAPAFFDETDALATAVCHILQGGNMITPKSKKETNNWAAFLKQNPERKL